MFRVARGATMPRREAVSTDALAIHRATECLSLIRDIRPTEVVKLSLPEVLGVMAIMYRMGWNDSASHYQQEDF